jgi:hypothetical protein
LEIVVDKGNELAFTPMTLRVEPIRLEGRVHERVSHIGETAAPQEAGTPGQLHDEVHRLMEAARCIGGHRSREEWKITEPRASVGFPTAAGGLWQATLAFTIPPTLKPGMRTRLQVFQRNDGRVMCGRLLMELTIPHLE